MLYGGVDYGVYIDIGIVNGSLGILCLFSIGWEPSTFKSSRQQKTFQMQQNPEMYMDTEVTTWIYDGLSHLYIYIYIYIYIHIYKPFIYSN